MHRAPTHSKARSHGFTLLELLVVLLIMALGSAGVAWSLRQTPEQALEREAQRLIYWLEVARVQASADKCRQVKSDKRSWSCRWPLRCISAHIGPSLPF